MACAAGDITCLMNQDLVGNLYNSNQQIINGDYTGNDISTSTEYQPTTSSIPGSDIQGYNANNIFETNTYADGTIAPPAENTNTNTNNNNTSSAANNWKAGAAVVGSLAGIANAWLGYKNYKLASKEFKFQKATTNRNLHNQALMINEQLDRRTAVGNSLAGRTLTQEQKQARVQATNKRHVDGSAISTN